MMNFISNLFGDKKKTNPVSVSLSPMSITAKMLVDPYLNYRVKFEHFGSTTGKSKKTNIIHFYSSDEHIFDIFSKLKEFPILLISSGGTYDDPYDSNPIRARCKLIEIKETTSPLLPKWVFEFEQIEPDDEIKSNFYTFDR